MKSKILILIAVLFSVSTSAQTNVSGFINANTIWTVASSPYIIVGNALLSHGYTLTIDPGVVIKFDANKALQIDGELYAVGTNSNRIVFTSNQPVPASGDWAKIHFSDTSTNAVFDILGNYLSGSIMKYCDVMYGGSLGYGQIHIERSSPYFNNCSIMNSGGDGIYCDGATYNIDSSTVKNNAVGLSFFSPGATSCGIRIDGDSILNNQFGGVTLNGSPGCTTVISNNYFYANASNGAIHLGTAFHQNVKIADNSFVNNSGSSVVYVEGAGTTISSNYFLNNYSSGSLVHSWGHADTIRCNSFIGNTGSGAEGSFTCEVPHAP